MFKAETKQKSLRVLLSLILGKHATVTAVTFEEDCADLQEHLDCCISCMGGETACGFFYYCKDHLNKTGSVSISGNQRYSQSLVSAHCL